MRRLLGLLTAALLAVTACSAPPAAPAAGPWTFTDDLGATVSLPARPTRVAGLTDVVASLWNYGITPVAVFGFTGVTQDPRFAGRDLSGVTELGRSYGQVNLEALAAARPDVIVTHVYPADSAGTIDPNEPLYGFADLAQQQAAARIAPIITLKMDGSAVAVTDRTVSLALALGADPGAVEASRAGYTEAADRLRRAAASGLTVMAVAAYPDEGFYVAKAPDDPSLTAYADLGVRFLDPGGTKYYWQVVSWENVPSLQADVVLESQIDPMPPAELLTRPTFAPTPAAKARQVFPWVFASMDFVGQAAYMNELAGDLDGSRVVTR